MRGRSVRARVACWAVKAARGGCTAEEAWVPFRMDLRATGRRRSRIKRKHCACEQNTTAVVHQATGRQVILNSCFVTCVRAVRQMLYETHRKYCTWSTDTSSFAESSVTPTSPLTTADSPTWVQVAWRGWWSNRSSNGRRGSEIHCAIQYRRAAKQGVAGVEIKRNINPAKVVSTLRFRNRPVCCRVAQKYWG